MRRTASLLASLLFLLPAAGAVNSGGGSEIIVAVIDTGMQASHTAFDYRGAASTSDQIVAWWDFTAEHKPAERTNPFDFPGATWDQDIADPYDNHGHGTATASLVGGRLVSGGCGFVSHAPGVKLAILKVGTGSGDVTGDLALAIRFATQVVKADVISMSIGAIVPAPSLGDDTMDAFAQARAAGVLPVVSAGNGLLNFGLVPMPTWATMYGSSTDVLAVGGGSVSGNTLTSVTGNVDPDVSAASDNVCAANRHPSATNQYGGHGGTSFAAPLVAGMAAKAMELAVANGNPATPDRIEAILKGCARDTIAPYAREGWGFLGPPEMSGCIAPYAAAGTTPTYGGGAENPLYGALVADTLRTGFSADPMRGTQASVAVAPATTGAGRLGESAAAGAYEAEGWQVTLAAGQAVKFDVTYLDRRIDVDAAVVKGPDFDLALFPAAAYDDGILLPAERLVLEGAVGGVDEHLEYTAAASGTYVLVVYGFFVTEPIGFDVATNGPAATLRSEMIYVGHNVA